MLLARGYIASPFEVREQLSAGGSTPHTEQVISRVLSRDLAERSRDRAERSRDRAERSRDQSSTSIQFHSSFFVVLMISTLLHRKYIHCSFIVTKLNPRLLLLGHKLWYYITRFANGYTLLSLCVLINVKQGLYTRGLTCSIFENNINVYCCV